ncbi:MAG: SusD/RagB family nutrient-binding outer membrane lipoprotein [Saprospiraceae bacterium]|nr:SusD/RagB family nutrient-binding outer membrane lipoprotein [Saprospiraceae bacterium]
MKKLLYRFAAIAIIAALGSCNFIDPELNIDPNLPQDATVELLLPSAQAMYGYVLGGDYGRYTTIWSQHHGGATRQHAGYDTYGLKEADVNNAWNNLYASVLKDLDLVVAKASESKSPYYSGIAKIMTAMTLATLVDVNDDIPYSAAVAADDNNEGLKPTYDDAADVYAAIQGLLDEAINDLNSSESTLSPASKGGDLVFDGDLGKWIAAANTLKARYYIRLSEVDNDAYSKALAAIDAGAIADNGGNAAVPFGLGSNSANPWYQFEDQRGDVVMGAFFIDLMNSINDPRRAVFAAVNDGGIYQGMIAGMQDGTPAISRFGTAYASINSPVPLVNYAEAKFLEAEAALGTDPARAAEAHNEAIAASLASFGLDDPAFLAAEASEDQNSITLEKILTHKYIALYTMQEPYNDFRRKGIPALQPAIGQTKIAVRYPYPSGERLYNGDNYPGQPNLFTGNVFWDVD